MAFPGARVVVLCCFFVHFAVTADYFLFQANTNTVFAFVSFVQGATLLFFPLLGLLVDICCTQYNFIKGSILLFLVPSILMVACALVSITMAEINRELLVPVPFYISISTAALISSVLLSVGMFKSIAI